MTIEEKKIKEAFRLGCYVAVGICLLSLPFIEPLRGLLSPSIEKFVKEYSEVLLNALYAVFFICSITLVFLVALVQREYQRMKSVEESFKSQQVVRNYYEKAKTYDFTKAISTAISKFSRRDLGPAADAAEEVTTDGTHQVFYSNGQLEKEFTYKQGKLNGPWRSYYSDGLLHQEKYYKDGMLSGVFRAYDDQGVSFFETNYKNGQKHGTEKTFHRNGSLQYLDTFQEGRLVNRKTFDESGEMKFDHDYHVDEERRA